jgi:hypothetical protein
MKNYLVSFAEGFVKGAKETPKAYFAPMIALWRLLVGTSNALTTGARQRSTIADQNGRPT